jgi:hypothetical protein
LQAREGACIVAARREDPAAADQATTGLPATWLEVTDMGKTIDSASTLPPIPEGTGVVKYARMAAELEVYRIVVDRLEQLIEAHRAETMKGEDTSVWFEEDRCDIERAIGQALHLRFCNHAEGSNPSAEALGDTVMRLWDVFDSGGCAFDVKRQQVRVVDDVEAR